MVQAASRSPALLTGQQHDRATGLDRREPRPGTNQSVKRHGQALVVLTAPDRCAGEAAV
jgi:hypothetical protein